MEESNYPVIEILENTGNAYIDSKLRLLLESRLVKTQNSLIPFFKMTATDRIQLDPSDCEND